MTPGHRTAAWAWHGRLGRFQFSLRVLRHRGYLPTRVVIQPSLVYDRKDRG